MKALERAKESLESYSNEFIKKKVNDSVTEVYLAIKLLEDELVRNACGKAFQAWKDLISAMLYLKKDEIVKLIKDRDWFLKKGIYAPSSRLSPLSKLLEEVGVSDISFMTDKALRLHTYQYQGPDPEGLWGGPVDKEDAKKDLILLLNKWVEYLERYFEKYLSEESKELLKVVKEKVVV